MAARLIAAGGFLLLALCPVHDLEDAYVLELLFFSLCWVKKVCLMLYCVDISPKKNVRLKKQTYEGGGGGRATEVLAPTFLPTIRLFARPN